MKVKELIKFLADFNPDADVLYHSGNGDYPIIGYAWKEKDGSDKCESERNIADEKLNAESVSLTSSAEFNREDRK